MPKQHSNPYDYNGSIKKDTKEIIVIIIKAFSSGGLKMCVYIYIYVVGA